jgi:hypothetical protein
MITSQLRRTAIAASIIAVAAVSLRAAGPVPLRRDAELLKQKFVAISNRAEARLRQPARTTLTETEVNAYLAFETADDLPTGVVEPSLSILGSDRVTGRAVVDLDQVRKERNPTSLLDPLRYLRGRLQVSATGLVHAANGVATFELEAADVAGVPIPKFLLQEIVSYYSRSPERPSGFSLDDRYPLPAGIREIQVLRGQAVVVQ